MLYQLLTIYLSGATGFLFIGTWLEPEVRLERILIAAFAWPVVAWRMFGRYGGGRPSLQDQRRGWGIRSDGMSWLSSTMRW